MIKIWKFSTNSKYWFLILSIITAFYWLYLKRYYKNNYDKIWCMNLKMKLKGCSKTCHHAQTYKWHGQNRDIFDSGPVPWNLFRHFVTFRLRSLEIFSFTLSKSHQFRIKEQWDRIISYLSKLININFKGIWNLQNGLSCFNWCIYRFNVKIGIRWNHFVKIDYLRLKLRQLFL